MDCNLTYRLKVLAHNMAMQNNEGTYKQMFQLLFTSLFRLFFSILKNQEQAEEIRSDVIFGLSYKEVGSFSNETITQVLTAMHLIKSFNFKTNHNDITIY